MSLSPADRRRFARHVLVAEIGELGQERMLATRYSAPSTPAGDCARAFLRRAGAVEDPTAEAIPLEAAHVASEPIARIAPAGGPARTAVDGALAAVDVLLRAMETLR